MRSELDILTALDAIIRAHPTGSYEELAGAEATLRWVLDDDPDIPRDRLLGVEVAG